MTPDEYREAAHRLVDWVADFRQGLDQRPVRSSVVPGATRDALSGPLPEAPGDLRGLIDDLEEIILPATTHPQHPGWFAFFPANASLASVLGDMVAAGLGQIGITWESSPALTELEEVTCDWLREAVGLSPAWKGTIHDTASTGALVAMLSARERASGFSMAGGGLQAVDQALVVYASQQAHSSVDKAALLAGFGRANVRLIETDENFAMRADRLAEAMADDLAAGRRPTAIVATVGTTGTTAVDPVAAIIALGRRHEVWVHVDAAMAGSAMLLPEMRWMWEGVEGADSITINPHKWMATALDCSLFLIRDLETLIRVMSTNPSYLQSSADGSSTQYRDWGIPLGRRFRALKLWFHLRLEGLESIRARIRRDLENARHLEQVIRATPGWVVVAPVSLQTVCVRHQPGGLHGEQLDRHTLAWVERVNRSGEAYLTPARLSDGWMVRISIGAEPTEWHHIERMWNLCREAVDEEAMSAPLDDGLR